MSGKEKVFSTEDLSHMMNAVWKSKSKERKIISAAPEHLEMMRKDDKSWIKWRTENITTDIKFSLADLSGIDFCRQFFSDRDIYKGAKMVKCKLTGHNICDMDFSSCDLQSSNLKNTMARRVNFKEADLQKANLNNAHLQGAEFRWTDLRTAKFRNAELRQTRFIGTKLSGADFTGALVDATVFADVDLSEVIGLDTLLHRGPSSLSFDTVIKSGRLPEVFLRGCGIPENFIDYMPSLIGSPFDYYSCFISYTHKDKAFARRLHDALQGRGIRCWLDEHQLLPGDDIYDQVDRGLKMWDKVLLCCSKDSLQSWWVDNEIEKAFKKEQALMKKKGEKTLALIPLNLDGFLFEWENGKGDQVRSRLAADFRGWKSSNTKFETQFELIVKALQTGDIGREAPPLSKL